MNPWGFGLLGFVMDRYQFPTVPLIIALILGQALELSLIQSLIVFRGNFILYKPEMYYRPHN